MKEPTNLSYRTERRVDADSSTRRPWLATRLALAFVGLVLAAILVVPLLVRQQVDTLRDRIAEIAQTARESSEAISRTLAIEVAADRAYQLTDRAEFRDRFREAWTQQEAAFERLTGVAPLLGGGVADHTRALREAVLAWGALPLRTIAGVDLPGEWRTRLDSQERLFERTVIAATALDAAIHRAAEAKRDEAAHIASFAAFVTAGLSALALVALLIVTWLAAQLRRFARDEAEMRAQLQMLFAARDRLIRGFSHDVKNPLGAADGFVALIEEGIIREPAKQREAWRSVRSSIRTALRLIEDVLELARAEAGQLQLHITPVDIAHVAMEVAEEYRAQVETAGMRLSVEIENGVPWLPSDAARIQQIVGNLISNAVKYAGAGGAVGVRVAAGSRWPAQRATDWVRIDVWDRGPGIPADSLERVFDEFTRLQPGGKEGAGLGLAISRRLARALGGELTVESTPEQGSRFILWLPAATALAA